MVNNVPESLGEALRIRARADVIPYGGGTDLMVAPKQGATYLFLHKVPEMRGISDDGAYIRIGASRTFSEVAESPICPAILREAILQIAAPAIRNLGTIGGNIGNGSPKADTAPVFYVTGAAVRLMSESGERILPIREFYLGRNKTALKPDELIVEVLMPKPVPARYYYRKVGGRQALAISRISFAGILEETGGRIASCAVAIGAVSDTIIWRDDIDAMLVGKSIAETKALKSEYLAAYDAAIEPLRGRVSSGYRKSVCMNLLNDFLDTLL